MESDSYIEPYFPTLKLVPRGNFPLQLAQQVTNLPHFEEFQKIIIGFNVKCKMAKTAN